MSSLEAILKRAEIEPYGGKEVPKLPLRVVETSPGKFCVSVPGTGYQADPFLNVLERVSALASGWRAVFVAAANGADVLNKAQASDFDRMVEIVWSGLIDANNGNGTHEDIQSALESAGYGCPESLEEYGS